MWEIVREKGRALLSIPNEDRARNKRGGMKGKKWEGRENERIEERKEEH